MRIMSLSLSFLLESVSKAESKTEREEEKKYTGSEQGPSGLIILIISTLSAFLKKKKRGPLKDARLG